MEQRDIPPEVIRPKEYSRRAVVKSGIGIAAAGLLTAAGVPFARKRFNVSQDHVPAPTQTPSVENELQKQPFTQIEPPEEIKEQSNTIEGHLLDLYKNTMEPTTYKDETEKYGFFKELTEIARDLNPYNPHLPHQLAAAINFETGGSFSPSLKNLQGYDAVGLIQFTPATAETLGTTYDEICNMSWSEQLQLVKQNLQNWSRELDINYESLTDVYMSILRPDGMGKNFNHRLFSRTDSDPEKRESYIGNQGLDIDLDGSVTVGEATERVMERALAHGEDIHNLLTLENIKDREKLVDVKERFRDFQKEIEKADPDFDMLTELSEANRSLYEGHDPDKTRRTLSFAKQTLETVYEDEPFVNDLNLESAYMLADVLRENPETFSEIRVNDPELLKLLPVGSLVIFNPNDKNSDEYRFDEGNGRIVFIQGNKPDGTCMNGSDRETRLEDDLSEMRAGFSVFVPKAK